MSKEKRGKKVPIKRIVMILLTYLIPLINILFLISNYSDLIKIVLGACGVLASTAAASACTIKGIKDEVGKLSVAQPFALVLSMAAFIIGLIYEYNGTLFLNPWIVCLFVLFANGITIYMFCIVDNEIAKIIELAEVPEEEKKDADEMVKKADAKSASSSNSTTMCVTKKGGKK